MKMSRPKIYAIIATTPENGIAFQGKLPWPRNSKDMKYFHTTTSQITQKGKKNIILMGSTTWKIDLKCKKLNNRMNVILSRDQNFIVDDLDVCVVR